MKKHLQHILGFALIVMIENLLASNDCQAIGCVCNILNASGQSRSQRNLTISCRDKNLSAIPHQDLDFYAWRAASIDLGSNSILSIEANAFSTQTDLKRLVLHRNQIERVNVASFNVSSVGESKLVSPLEYIDFRDNHLHYFPSCFGRINSTIAALDNLHTLLIGGNLFGTKLEMEVFFGIRNLRYLDLSRCLIRVVEDLTFKMLFRLEFLDLSNNNIYEMSSMIFAQSVPLQVLRLQENQLLEFPKNLPNRLKEIDLSSNNVESIHQRDYASFCQIKNLEILDLGNNKIVYLLPHVFSCLSKLRFLDLSQNRLEIMEVGTFNGLESLEVLLLHTNLKLMQIADFSYAILPQLGHLFLHQCRLETLTLEKNNEETTTGGYPPLKNLWLFGNPLTCDCYMLPLVKFIKQKKVNLDAEKESILANISDSKLREKLSKKLSKNAKANTSTMCSKPLNRHHKVVGIPILEVSESYFSCPNEPIYIVISCFLGIIAFVGVIPIVFVLILAYLSIQRFFQTHFGFEKEKED